MIPSVDAILATIVAIEIILIIIIVAIRIFEFNPNRIVNKTRVKIASLRGVFPCRHKKTIHVEIGEKEWTRCLNCGERL